MSMLNKLLNLLFVCIFLFNPAFGQSKKTYIKEAGENDHSILNEKFRNAKLGDTISITTVPANEQESSGLSISAQSQTIIKLKNPSFEDEPQPGKTPRGWYNCGSKGESPPDIQPNDMYRVTKEAFHGNTYLGLVVRDNETWEAVGQKLETPLLAGKTYSFSIQIARSQYYVSLSRTTSKEVNYTTGCKLKIFGGNEYCDKLEILDETKRVNNSRWLEFTCTLKPKTDINYIMFQAYYVEPTLFAYNGNLLLDNCSDIVEINVNETNEKLVAEEFDDVTSVNKYLDELFATDTELTEKSHANLKLLKSIHQFKNSTKTSGLRQYLFVNSVEDQMKTRNELKQFGAEKLSEHYKTITSIYTKSKKGDELTPEEIKSFENCEAPFKALLEEEMETQWNRYIEENFFVIKQEMKSL